MSSWRLAFRLSRRQARRRPARTALIVLLIGLPVAGIVVGSMLVRTLPVSSAQGRTWLLGAADVVVSSGADQALAPADERAKALISSLPAGSRALVTHSSSELFSSEGQKLDDIEVRDVSMVDPLVKETRQLRAGRAPSSSGEIAVSPSVLRATGLDIGDVIELSRSGLRARITGIVVDPSALDARVAVIGGRLDSSRPDTLTRIYIELPANAPASISTGSRSGFFSETLAYAYQTDAQPLEAVRLFGGVALVVAAIVASAAFAAGARRHLRDLGLLAAGGGAPHHLVRVMAVEGVVLGAAGAIVGVLLGLIATAGLAPHLEHLAGHLIGGIRLPVGDLLSVAALGLGAAVAAAWMPARTAYGLPVLAALAGRRPLRPVPRAVPVVGAVMVGIGLGLVVWTGSLSFGSDLWQFSLVGAVLMLLGAVVMTPWIVAGLEVAGRRLRGPARLAVRSVTRQRVRSAAVIAAVMAAASMTVAGSAALLGGDAERRAAYTPGLEPDQVVTAAWHSETSRGITSRAVSVPGDITRAIGLALPGSTHASRYRVVPAAAARQEPGAVVSLRLNSAVSSPVQRFVGPPQRENAPDPTFVYNLWTATPGLLDVLGAPEAAIAPLQADGPVVFGPRSISNVTGKLWVGSVEGKLLSVAVVGTDRATLWGTGVLSPKQVDALRLDSRLDDVMFRSHGALTESQRHALDAVSVKALRLETSQGSVWLNFERPLTSDGRLRGLLLGIALLFSLGVVALGSSLAAAEGRGERALIKALGAPPRSARRIRVVEAAILAGVGGVLAVPVGFVPAAAFLAGRGGRLIVFPWTAALAVAIVIPTVVAAATGMVARMTGRRQLPASLLSAD